jgi:hypothetical protein
VGIDNELDGGTDDATAALDVRGVKELGTEKDALNKASNEVGIDSELDNGIDEAIAALDVSGAKELGTEEDNARTLLTTAIDKLGRTELKPPTIAKLARVPTEDVSADVKAI